MLTLPYVTTEHMERLVEELQNDPIVPVTLEAIIAKDNPAVLQFIRHFADSNSASLITNHKISLSGKILYRGLMLAGQLPKVTELTLFDYLLDITGSKDAHFSRFQTDMQNDNKALFHYLRMANDSQGFNTFLCGLYTYALLDRQLKNPSSIYRSREVGLA